MRSRSSSASLSPVLAVGGVVVTVALCSYLGVVVYNKMTDSQTYCTDGDDKVVPNEWCDPAYTHAHGGGIYYVHVMHDSGHNYRAGDRISSGSSNRALFSDSVGRTNIGAGTGAIGKAGGTGGSAKGGGGS